jgi:hypothetical protein
LGETAVVETSVSRANRPDVHGPPSLAGFGISGVLGSASSYANRRKQRGVVSLSHAIASLEAEKSSRASPGLLDHLRNGDTVVVGSLGGASRNQPALERCKMIHHVSIPAREPRHVAEVLAELMGGKCHPFGPLEGAFMA